MQDVEGADLPTIYVPRSTEELGAYWGNRAVRKWPVFEAVDPAVAMFLSEIGLPAVVGDTLRFGPAQADPVSGRILIGRNGDTPIWLDADTNQILCGDANDREFPLVNQNLRTLSQFLAIWDQYLQVSGALSDLDKRVFRRHIRRIFRNLDPSALEQANYFWAHVLSGTAQPRVKAQSAGTAV